MTDLPSAGPPVPNWTFRTSCWTGLGTRSRNATPRTLPRARPRERGFPRRSHRRPPHTLRASTSCTRAAVWWRSRSAVRSAGETRSHRATRPVHRSTLLTAGDRQTAHRRTLLPPCTLAQRRTTRTADDAGPSHSGPHTDTAPTLRIDRSVSYSARARPTFVVAVSSRSRISYPRRRTETVQRRTWLTASRGAVTVCTQ